MRKFILCFVLLGIGCGPSIDPSDFHNLNGYWEIEAVTAPDGKSRTYPASTTIDYIQLNERSGYRKKVQPRLDGTFSTSDDALPIELRSRGDQFYIRYGRGTERWEEQLLEVAADHFSIRSPEGITYRYKRFEAFNFNP